jgi:predicted transcriptional regulator
MGRAEPELRYVSGVIAFLGYDPYPEPQTLGQRIRRTRMRQGISHRELARQLGLDPSTVASWERDEVRRPYPRYRRLFEEYVGGVV